MPGRVRQQVAEHLDDALRVGHRAGEVRREIDREGVAAPAGQEGGPGLVDQRGDARGLGVDGERARLDAPRVEEVGDEAVHMVGLGVDDADELEHLGTGRGPRGGERRSRRALDRGEGGAELVAHHPEELGALTLELDERAQVLHRDDDRDHLTLPGPDRRDVDQRADAPPVGPRELDLLGAHLGGALEVAREGKLLRGELPSGGVPPGHHLEELPGGAARGPDLLDDPRRLAVEGDRASGRPVEYDDSDRRGLDERLEIGLRPLDVRLRPLHRAVGPRVRDRRSRLGGEEDEDLLVLVGERLSVLLVGEEEVAEMHAPVVHRGALERSCAPGMRRESERAEVAGEVGDAERTREVAEVLEETRAVRPLEHRLPLRGRMPGGDEVADLSPRVDRGDDGVACPGESACAADGLLEDGGQLEALGDPQDRRAQPRGAVTRRRAPLRITHRHTSRRGVGRPDFAGRRGWTIAPLGRAVTDMTCEAPGMP